MSEEKSKVSDVPVLPKFWDDDDEALSQECRDLIATLPNEPFFQTHHRLYKFEGFWHNKRVIQGVLNLQKHFQAHDSDIILVTMPKSGTTWLKALAYSILNRKTHHPNPNTDPTRNSPAHPLLSTNPHDLVPFLELHLFLENNPDLSSFPSPRLFAAHLPYFPLPESIKSSTCKIVYLCRNPKDVFVSFWHFTSTIRKGKQDRYIFEDFFGKFCQGVNPFGPFWYHLLGYYRESLKRPEKIMFLRYEYLKSEPVRVVKDLAEFIGHGFSKEEENDDVIGDIVRLCSFENMSNLEVNKSGKSSIGVKNKGFFRSGEVGDSKNFLSPDMIKQLDDIIEEKLGIHGLKF